MSNSIPREKEKTSKPLNVMQAILDNLAWIIVTVVVGIVLLVGGAILTHKPFYTVSASILFEPHIPELVYESNERYLHSFEDWICTQAHEIESHGVLVSAITANENEGFHWKLPAESDKTAADRLRGKLNISQINNTQIMILTMGSGRKEGLAELVNFVVQKYIEHKDQQRKEQDQKKLSHLRNERDKYGIRLDQSYKDLMQISRKYATAVADEKNLYIYLNMFMDLRSRYNEVLTKRIETENKLEALRNQKTRLLKLDIYDLQNTQLLLEMEQEINSKMVGLNPESAQYIEFSQIIKDIDQENIETARKYLISELDKEINNQMMLNESASNSEIDLKGELTKAQIEVMEFNTAILRASKQRQGIERIIGIWNRINERIEQIEIELFNPGRVRILSAALPPELPNPNKLIKKILLGIIAMIGLVLGLAILKEVLDNKIKRTADIEKVLGFPASGFLLDGKVENILPVNMINLYRKHPGSFMAELYKQLTVRIEKEHLEHGSQTFAMFSLKGQSGVTTTASNILAMLDADKGKKILVDLNSRHPLNKQFDYYQEKGGLAHWLTGNRKLEECIISHSEAKFDVLPLGGLEESGLSRISPSVVVKLLSLLKEQYTYIFIEGPALLLSSEAQILAQKADVSALVLNAQKDTWPELIRTVILLEKLQVSVISIILNKVKLMRAGYIKKSIKEYNNGKKVLQPPAAYATAEALNG